MPTLKRLPKEDEMIVEERHNPLTRDEIEDKFSQPLGDGDVRENIAQHESLSIASAISSYNTNSKHITDIVGVVLSITAQHPEPSKICKRNNTRVRILIADHSVPPGQCARVSISTNLDGSEVSNIHSGDIVRFNRMEVRNVDMENKCITDESPLAKKRKQRTEDNDNNLAEASKNEHLLLKVICDLYPSWKELSTEPTMSRLCRLKPSIQPNNPNLEWENEITSFMKTPRELINKLAKWYCATIQHSSSSSSTAQPCQRRRLRDITMPNIVSHVVVKVLRCEKTSLRCSRQDKKQQCVTHATLSDGSESDDIMGISGSLQLKQTGGDSFTIPNSIAAILLQSLTEGCHILLTHVVSQRAVKNSSLEGREALKLLPTQGTIATIITSDHPFYIKNSPRIKENSFASQPITLERASELFSLSQQHSPNYQIADDLQSSRCRGMMAVVSPCKFQLNHSFVLLISKHRNIPESNSVRDILVDGIFASFREGRYWQTNSSLSKFLVDTPSLSTPFKSIKLRPSYRSATIVLDPSVFSKEMIVNADSDALKLLCMDVPAEDMVVDDDNDVGQHRYLTHVGALLKGLCEEKTLIRWVLEQESERSWFVTSASLIEI